MPGLRPAVAANRTVERAIDALRAAGVHPSDIRLCDDPRTAQAALADGHSVATGRLTLPAELDGIDVVMESTCDVLVGPKSP